MWTKGSRVCRETDSLRQAQCSVLQRKLPWAAVPTRRYFWRAHPLHSNLSHRIGTSVVPDTARKQWAQAEITMRKMLTSVRHKSLRILRTGFANCLLSCCILCCGTAVIGPFTHCRAEAELLFSCTFNSALRSENHPFSLCLSLFFLLSLGFLWKRHPLSNH